MLIMHSTIAIFHAVSFSVVEFLFYILCLDEYYPLFEIFDPMHSFNEGPEWTESHNSMG